MQKISSLAILLSVLVLAGAGCANKNPEKNNSTFTAVDNTPNQTTTAPAATNKVVIYRGAWFDVKYPENFTAAPTQPTLISKNSNTRVRTDEATFTSPDNNIEFFVYSPLWNGDPKEYLKIKDTEELVSEKISTTTDRNSDLQRTRWVTIKAKDNSYYRSFVSITGGINLGSLVHHVFGIKYKNDAAYEQYKNDYLKFKESLIQYAD